METERRGHGMTFVALITFVAVALVPDKCINSEQKIGDQMADVVTRAINNVLPKQPDIDLKRER